MSTSSPKSRDRQMLKMDCIFALLLIASFVGLISEGFDSTPAIAEVDEPWLLGAILIGVVLSLSLLIARFADVDRHCSEEYSFQLVTNAAVVGVVVTMIANIVLSFDFLMGRWFEQPSADHLMSILMGSWATGYFIYRIRGTV